MRYFFDECLSHRLALMLRALDEDVVHISEAEGFARGDKDPVWLPKLATLGWVLVTDDARIRRKPDERALIEGLKIRAVFIAGGRPERSSV